MKHKRLSFGITFLLRVERMCAAIDGQEKAKHFQRLLQEYNEWLINQQRQQVMVQEFFREYYH